MQMPTFHPQDFDYGSEVRARPFRRLSTDRSRPRPPGIGARRRRPFPQSAAAPPMSTGLSRGATQLRPAFLPRRPPNFPGPNFRLPNPPRLWPPVTTMFSGVFPVISRWVTRYPSLCYAGIPQTCLFFCHTPPEIFLARVCRGEARTVRPSTRGPSFQLKSTTSPTTAETRRQGQPADTGGLEQIAERVLVGRAGRQPPHPRLAATGDGRPGNALRRWHWVGLAPHSRPRMPPVAVAGRSEAPVIVRPRWPCLRVPSAHLFTTLAYLHLPLDPCVARSCLFLLPGHSVANPERRRGVRPSAKANLAAHRSALIAAAEPRG